MFADAVIGGICWKRAALLTLAALLAGCAGVAPPKRHSPDEIARYRESDFIAPIASREGERAAREEALQRIREAALAPDQDPDGIVPTALWNVGFFNTEFETGRRLFLAALPTLPQKPPGYQRGILSAAYTFYATDAAPWLTDHLTAFTTPREFAMAAYALLRAGDSPERRAAIRTALRGLFADWQTEPRLIQLDYVLSGERERDRQARPPLADLLAAPYVSGKPVVFSFQRQDRQRFGLAVVRRADGRFVRRADGSLFAVAHLANAITDLPGTITNGNTPQGLFTVVGAGTATNKWIGPTPYLESRVPKEASVAEYLHADPPAGAPEEWTEARYESLLPVAWQRYRPFKEAWLAGLAGRDEMLIHGTTIDSGYYTGKSYYPGTPSAGCLVAMETWSPEEGRLLASDQLSLVKAFTLDGIDRGFLVVVELDDRLDPVSLADVLADIEAAERQLAALRR